MEVSKSNSISKRIISLDLMRIFACFCVIVIHVGVYNQKADWTNDSLSLMFANFYGIISRWAVPCFVMLSGMMFLNNQKQVPLKKLYFRYILRLFVSYIFWSVVYSIYNSFYIDSGELNDQLMYIVNNLFSGEIHMWYVLMLIGLYIAMPVIKYIVNNASEKLLNYWIAAMFIFSSVIPFIADLGIPYISGVVAYFNEYINIQFLCGYTLYFVLGSYISQKSFTKKQNRLIYILGLIGFIYSVLILLPGRYFFNLSIGALSYLYPNIIFMSLSVMLLFKNVVSKVKFSDKSKMIIFQLSKLTYGIFLIHVLALKVLYNFGFNLSICPAPVSMIIVPMVTFIISALVVFLISKIPVINKYIC